MKLYCIFGDEKGFTFIELMIAMVVAVLMLLGVMAANSAVQKASEAGHQRVNALQDANQVIERMRNTAQTGSFPSNVVAIYPNNGTVSGFSSLTSETVTVSYADRNGDGIATNDDPLDVTVTVAWSENGERTTNTALRTLLTQRT